MIYNKKREKNEIINIGVDKDKDIEGYVNIYKEIVNDKLEFVNEISKLFDNANEKKEFRNLKDGVLKLIDNSCKCDHKRKGCKKNNKEKDSDVKGKGCKKDNNNKEKDSDDRENDNNNNNNNNNDDDNNDNDSENDNDNHNLINKLLNNNNKLHNFSDKVLNNLLIVAKLKEEILINDEKLRAIFNKIENKPKNDLRSKFNKYKKLNILIDDFINHIWRMIYGKTRVNNEIDNIYCDIDVDVKRYADKYIKVVNDKQVLIYCVRVN